MRTTTLLSLMLVFPGLSAADGTVRLTTELPYVDVLHQGKPVRIERNPDPDNMLEPDYTLTSRPCPPFCIQPIQAAPGVETLGELELIDYLRRMSAGDSGVLVVDSREYEWPLRSGIIPGALVIPWVDLLPAKTDPQRIAETLEDRFGAAREGPLWNFQNARTLVLYCNGSWCGQSPTAIKALIALGYPAAKLKWYRDGIQGWKALGLTTVPYTRP